MTEKVYKTMGNTGAANLAIGIIMIIVGVASGVILLIAAGGLVKYTNSKK